MSYKIIGKVIDIKGTCAAGLKVGDKIDLTIPCLPEDYEEWKKKPKICPHLLTSISPQVLILQGGGKIPWESKKDEGTVMCPDPENIVTLVIKRVEASLQHLQGQALQTK